MKLTSCARTALACAVVFGIAGCKPETLPPLPCDSTTVVVHRKVFQSTPRGLRVVDVPDRDVVDSVKIPGTYTVQWGEGMFAESWIYLRARHAGRDDSIAPILFIASLWDVGKTLPPEAAPIKRCYDTVKAHFPDAH
jgi:hypothetical protein